MQFITGGPEVPDRLIQAHEEGRVVFFCGAGISYPAGLPGFKGLVDRLYEEMSDSPNSLEKAALKTGKYDTAIGLLEDRLAPHGRGRELVRPTVARILTPSNISPKTTATHASLLTLARCRHGQTRLVTTNFDRLFAEVIARDNFKIDQFHAPLLPLPKNHWSGLVYLHGLLTAEPSKTDLDRLVLSSGDFGLAYLTERWAARFVSELFCNYTVCFVGYSINDPVLRYMMDALAADRIRGESPPEMFAFGSYSKGKEDTQKKEWCSKNVTPILYREHQCHAYLHRTLNAWAATYRDGISGKEQIIAEHAHLQPQHSTLEENFVGRVLWAVSDATGLPARLFAEMEPAPSFEWFTFFAEPRFGRDDLTRFGVPPLPEIEEKQLSPNRKSEFSLLDRPACYLHAPYMAITYYENQDSKPDNVMYQLARWLLRYLDEPRLIFWLATRGNGVSHFFANLVERRLNEIGKWEQDGKTTELDKLRHQSPQGIPGPVLRPLWRLLLSKRLCNKAHDYSLYEWFEHFCCDGLTTGLRLALRELLAPRIQLRKLYSDKALHIELVLACNNLHSALLHYGASRASSDWQDALPMLLDDITVLLRDGLDLLAELKHKDFSYLYHPLISEESDNFDNWATLINLARDAWLATVATNLERARSAVMQWQDIRYPLFRRLTFFAATQTGVIPPKQALSWLLEDEAWWIWSSETEHEAQNLLMALVPQLDDVQLATLELSILKGPLRERYREDLEEEVFREYADYDTWKYLTDLHEAEIHLGAIRLDELNTQHPEWQQSTNHENEFFKNSQYGSAFESVPRHRQELMLWLQAHPHTNNWNRDDWAERCRKNFATTACALWALAQEGHWPITSWKRALHAWSEERLQNRAWRYLAPLLTTAPDNVMTELGSEIGWWLQQGAKVFDRHQTVFFTLCERMLALGHSDGVETNNPVTRAINHSVGQVTQALLNWWYRDQLKNDQGLSSEIALLFTRACDKNQQGSQHGRVLLAMNAINLFLVDRSWTTRYLLPYFEWNHSNLEASTVWEGFLHSPRVVHTYLAAIKPALLETAAHYDELGEHRDKYAAFLTYVALDPGDIFTSKELRTSFRLLPLEGLAQVAYALVRGMESAGEQNGSYWTNRVVRFWNDIWPKSTQTSPDICKNLFHLCIAAGTNFPAALNMVKVWLSPLSLHLSSNCDLIPRLHKSNLCRQFPETALEWLSLLLINTQNSWVPRELGDCLRIIADAAPELSKDHRYIKLITHSRQAYW